MIGRAVLLVCFILISSGWSHADDSYLPGHKLFFVDAVELSNTIFSGELLSIDPPETDDTGAEVYHAKVRVPYGPLDVNAVSFTRLGLIRGVLRIPKSGVPVRFTVSPEEHPPVVGKYYILFAKGDRKHSDEECAALKITIATQTDISDIRRLIIKLERGG